MAEGKGTRESYLQRFIRRMQEIERWAAHNKESVLGAILAETSSPLIDELIRSAKPEKRLSMLNHILDVLKSYFPDADSIVLRRLYPFAARVATTNEGKIIVKIDRLHPLTPTTRKLVFPHEKEHIKQRKRGDRSVASIIRLEEQEGGDTVALFLWRDWEVRAQKKALSQLESASEKIRYPVMFHFFSIGLSPSIIEDANFVPEARDRKELFRRLKYISEIRGFPIAFFSDAEDFYNYHFGPLVHEKDDISREEHWEAYLDALRLLKRYGRYQEDLDRVKEVTRKSIEEGGDIYAKVGEEVKNFFKKVSDDGLPIVPLLSTTYLYITQGIKDAAKKAEGKVDGRELYWHIVNKALEVLEEKYKKNKGQ